jgi:hypothetical protein
MADYEPLSYMCPAGKKKSIYVHRSLIERVEPDTKNPACFTVHLRSERLVGADIPLVYHTCHKHDVTPLAQGQGK